MNQIFRGLRIELWQKQPRFPPELIHWKEGNTEVDVIIRWENPANVPRRFSEGECFQTTQNIHPQWSTAVGDDFLTRIARFT